MISEPPETSHRWKVFCVICLAYFFVYFHRVSTSVIASDLLKAFNAHAASLGIMSSMYFYLYAFGQPIVGYLADRMGSRRVMGYWSLIAAAGSFLFGIAPTIGWASVGRALIGIGVGGIYVPAVRSISLWFDKKHFSALIGILMSIGNLGAVIATTPLAWAAAAWGWRSTFFVISGVTTGIAFLTLLGTPDHVHETKSILEKTVQPPSANSSPPRSNIVRVLASGQFWILGFIFFGIYGTVITLQGLWATPFLMTLGLDRILASKINMFIPVGVIIGSPLFGWLPNRFEVNIRNILIMIIAGYTLAWICLIFLFKFIGAAGLSAALLFMGVFTGGLISLVWGIVRETTPAEMLGLTSGMLNPAPFLGIAVFQVLTGAVLDKYHMNGGLYPISGFVRAFLMCLIASLICLILSFFIRKPNSTKTVDRENGLP